MSSVHVTRSSRASLRNTSSPPPAEARVTLKRPRHVISRRYASPPPPYSSRRSPASDTEADTLHPSKRSCLQIDIASTSDTDDDMPSLQSLSPSPAPTQEQSMPMPTSISHAVVNTVKLVSEPGEALTVDAIQHPPSPIAVDSEGAGRVRSNAESEDYFSAFPMTSDAGEPNPDPPVGGHPDFEGVDYIAINDLERAVAFANKCDPPNNRFAIAKVPTGAAWGSSPQTEKFLCIQERPVTVWFVGKVCTTWFFDMDGKPQARVNVAFTLPHKGDYDGVKHLLQLARPRRDDVPSTIYASRFQSRQQKGETEPTILPFKNVYDARTRFRAKNEMPLLPPAYIGRNDIVLVEAYFHRWKTAKDKKNRKAWTLWDVGFELQCASLLVESPLNIDDDDPLPNANVADDM
ncbi:hypothetical protein GSI_02252 [Ganoderma sinense ZZ0214-1]|uniref:Uncharacterized protein n=1 Tax=Ganoderma sinense ZZ0214-1 TaxID=1077348 RepID=A0A2G8SP22_9APHY|nr:hypothetical protein GSI_02252 [Ganoderma sinense ZZ0214-1]